MLRLISSYRYRIILLGLGSIMILVALTGWLNTNRITQNSELSNKAYQMLNQTHMAAQKGSLITSNDYLDVEQAKTIHSQINDIYAQIIKDIRFLIASGTLSQEDIELIRSVENSCRSYLTKFDEFVVTQGKRKIVATTWRTLGENIETAISDSWYSIIKYEKEKAYASGDINSIAKYSGIDELLDKEINDRFLRLQTAVAHLLVKHNDQSWSEFNTQLNGLRTGLRKFRYKARGNQSLLTVSKRIDDYLRKYELATIQYYNSLIVTASLVDDMQLLIGGIDSVLEDFSDNLQRDIAITAAQSKKTTLGFSIMGIIICILIVRFLTDKLVRYNHLSNLAKDTVQKSRVSLRMVEEPVYYMLKANKGIIEITSKLNSQINTLYDRASELKVLALNARVEAKLLGRKGGLLTKLIDEISSSAKYNKQIANVTMELIEETQNRATLGVSCANNIANSVCYDVTNEFEKIDNSIDEVSQLVRGHAYPSALSEDQNESLNDKKNFISVFGREFLESFQEQLDTKDDKAIELQKH